MSTPQKAVRDDSPRSLATGGSHYASPSTAATHYSPVDTRTNGPDHLYQTLVNKMGGLSNKSSNQSMTGEDPFVTSAHRANFSATAAEYQPGARSSVAELTHTSVPEYTAGTLLRSIENTGSNRFSYATYLANQNAGSAATISPTRLRNHGSSLAVMGPQGKFTTSVRPDGVNSFSRYVALTGIEAGEADNSNPNGALVRFRESGCMLEVRNVKKINDGLTLAFCYDQLEEAKRAYHSGSAKLHPNSQEFPAAWKLTFLAEEDIKDKPRTNEAEVLLTVSASYGMSSHEQLYNAVLSEIEAIGRVHAAEVIMPSGPLTIRVEMKAISAADALVRLHGRSSPKKVRDCRYVLIAEHFGEVSSDRDSTTTPSRYGAQLTPYKSQMQLSLYSPSPNARPQDTTVHPEAIRSGDDVRTTVMIRNIPNKVDAAQFKDILDTHVFGKYDFSYLRIDFQNLCNVGYAFVNFTVAADIIPLWEAIVGRHWNVYNSDKIAEMCYATIQGLDCCIEKFRNSSVMLEWQPHRPKLWYTEADGDLAGFEKDFPAPTNYQKLQRSKDNAAEVGLYPPRGITAYRQDTRQQISMLDRGHPRGPVPEFPLAGFPRGLLTYPPQLMSHALSPLAAPFNHGHVFGQPGQMSSPLYAEHQLTPAFMSPHTPAAAAMFNGGVGMADYYNQAAHQAALFAAHAQVHTQAHHAQGHATRTHPFANMARN